MLDICDLNIRSGQQLLVKHVGLHISAGEIFALVGESGSGKSLTCLSLLSLLPEGLQAEGQIRFSSVDGRSDELLGMDQTLRTQYALKKIAYIFQEPLTALNPVQTCGSQLLENIALCGVSGRQAQKERAIQLLNDVELTDSRKVMNAYPFQLSGGQRQRVMIAMAMAGDPELIVADEPTTALDVLLQDEILTLLQKLCREQKRSILLVSHDIDAVSRFSDRIAVMYKGEIVESGNTTDILTRPQHPYTKALLACKPTPDKKGLYLSTLADAMQPEGLVNKPFPEETVGSEVLAAIQNSGKDYRSDGQTYTALKDVSFEIRKGSSTGLIGESGSGKSTISKLLVQLEDASRGEIVYDFKNKRPLSSNVQMVFQDPFAALNPALRVDTMLLEVIRKHSADLNGKQQLAEAVSLLEKVGLSSSDLKKYPKQFSGGQRQRLCIARALAAKPQLLICDESTSALDLSVQAQILNLLKELQISEQLSILMVTHSMAVAAWFCTWLIVLKNGSIVEQGPAADVLANPKDPYTKAMVAHI